MIFKVDGRKFSLTKEKAIGLFGRNIKGAFARTDVDKDFVVIQSVRNAAIWCWMKKRNFTSRAVADEIGVTEAELLRWVNQRANLLTELLNQQPKAFEKVGAELEEKYPQPEVDPMDLANFDLKKARKLIMEDGLSFPEAAKQMKMTPQEFAELWQQNLSGLQKKIGG